MADFDITALTQEQLNQLQYDILFNNLDKNNLLHGPQGSNTDGALYTNSKKIIKAINEVLATSIDAKDATLQFKARFNDIIGDELDASNSNYVERLNQIGSNFFEAIFSLDTRTKDIETNLSSKEADIEIIKTSIRDLVRKVNELQNGGAGSSGSFKGTIYEENISGSEFIDDNLFRLTEKPISKEAISLFINGVSYSGDYFSYEPTNNYLILANSEKLGFPIEDIDTITVKYFYEVKEVVSPV